MRFSIPSGGCLRYIETQGEISIYDGDNDLYINMEDKYYMLNESMERFPFNSILELNRVTTKLFNGAYFHD